MKPSVRCSWSKAIVQVALQVARKQTVSLDPSLAAHMMHHAEMCYGGGRHQGIQVVYGIRLTWFESC